MPAGPSVLIVDDVPGLRALVRLALEESGRYDVVAEAADGIEAIERARTLRPDIILLDLAMPRMDGLEALPRLLVQSPGSRIVVLTGFAEERLGKKVAALGAIGYIEKGTTPGQLVNALDRAIGAAQGGPGGNN